MPDPDPLTLVADRLAISDLVHAYAQGVDRRDPDAVARLFTEDGIFVAYATPGAAEPTSRSEGRAAIAKAIGTARYYRQTTHTIGNHLATVRGDRRDPDAVARLFTEDGIFVAYATPGAAEPTSRSEGRAAIAKAIGTARYYRQTTHTIGNHLATVRGDRATGETRCVAYHVLGDEDTETLMVWHLRYLDAFARGPDGWRIHERVLRVDLVSDQPLGAG